MKLVKKVQPLYGIETAINILRPHSKWEVENGEFVKWDDPRPCPSWNEILETMNKIKLLEESVHTIWTDEQLNDMQEDTLNLKFR